MLVLIAYGKEQIKLVQLLHAYLTRQLSLTTEAFRSRGK